MDRPTFPGQRLFAHPAFQTVNGLFLTGFFGLAVLGAVNRERWLMSTVYDALVFAGLWLIGVARFGRTQRERQDEMWDGLLLDSNDTRRQRLESFRQVRR